MRLLKNILATCLMCAALILNVTAAYADGYDIEQKPETLRYNNEIFLLYTYPLDQNPPLYNSMKRQFQIKSYNGVARGYIGTWEIFKQYDGKDYIRLNSLEYGYGKRGELYKAVVGASDIRMYEKKYTFCADWVNGRYRAFRVKTEEHGSFTFQNGCMVSNTFRFGTPVIEGQSARATSYELSTYLRSKYDYIKGQMNVTAKYDFTGSRDKVTPTGVIVTVDQATADLQDLGYQALMKREISDYIMAHKPLSLYRQTFVNTVTGEYIYNMNTYDNNLRIDLTNAPLVREGRPNRQNASQKDNAKQDNKAQAKKGTKKHTVKSGEALSTIAKKYGTTVEKIKALNPQIKNINKVKVGDTIYVK